MYWYDSSINNSDQLQLSINNPGLLYGANVFSTMRVYEGALEHPRSNWQAHLDRLWYSIREFNWQQPNWQSLQQGAEKLSAHFPVLRITIFPDGKEWIVGRNLPADLKQRQKDGITAWIATGDLFQRNLAQHKTGNYLGAYLARNQALNVDAQEAILIDRQGNWLETSTGNLWGWRGGCWYTPSLDSGILPGIARSLLLKHFRTNDLLVQENIWTPKFVKTLEGICYSNCVVETVPITKVLAAGDRFNYSIIKLDFP